MVLGHRQVKCVIPVPPCFISHSLWPSPLKQLLISAPSLQKITAVKNEMMSFYEELKSWATYIWHVSGNVRRPSSKQDRRRSLCKRNFALLMEWRDDNVSWRSVKLICLPTVKASLFTLHRITWVRARPTGSQRLLVGESKIGPHRTHMQNSFELFTSLNFTRCFMAGLR